MLARIVRILCNPHALAFPLGAISRVRSSKYWYEHEIAAMGVGLHIVLRFRKENQELHEGYVSSNLR